MNADGDFVPSVLWETKQTHNDTARVKRLLKMDDETTNFLSVIVL